MIGSALWPLQQAIYTKLTADSTLMGKITGVYDLEAVPEGALLDYITFGVHTEMPQETFTSQLRKVTTTLDIWSNGNGTAGTQAAKSIQDDLVRLLHRATLTVTGWSQLVSLQYDFSTLLVEPDGYTVHIPCRFRALLEA